MHKTFMVPCTAEIDQHIGACEAVIVGESPTDWYIDSIHNKYGGEMSGENVSVGLYVEIEAEVREFFISASEYRGQE